ncbi:MAG: imidazole glycerol phosphate synthase, glutamine amidotransferase subunit [Deltaproteobacteria bacterium GWC2_42_11]|nr:MAG: imidazole glycerol phosphate synthase, glutamine amidotransferase subunit [Deltaproteobacteria bacterium GWC2_42_11]
MGNLRSVQKGFERVGHKCIITRNPKDILDASHVVLPGVGAFKDCMENLQNYGLIEPILNVINDGKPFLGICLGLQLLFTESEEFGIHKGLDIIKGRVVRFDFSNIEGSDDIIKVPHMGWNNIKILQDAPLLKDIPDNSYFYFVHSYYVVPEDEDVIATKTDYGIEFTSSIWKDNIFACQFHPEKSQKMGSMILKNFGDLK